MVLQSFKKYPYRCKVAGDLSIVVSGKNDADCVVSLYDEDGLLAERPIDKRLFDPDTGFNRDRINDIARKLASASEEINKEILIEGFPGAVFEVQAMRGYPGPRLEPYLEHKTPIEACQAPDWSVTPLDPPQKWTEFASRFDDWTDNDGLEIWGDSPGTGKSTSTAKAASDHEQSHVFYLPTHRNCQEFVDGDETPFGYFHLKGSKQPHNDCCMRAKVNEEECSDHDDPDAMCPIYNRPRHDPVREEYERLENEIGGIDAHKELDLFEKEWHCNLSDDDAQDDDRQMCRWLKQFEEIERRPRIVTVHAYLGLGLLEDFEWHIIDDLQNEPSIEREVWPSDLEKVTRVLGKLSESELPRKFASVFEQLHQFTKEIENRLVQRGGQLEDLSPLSFEIPPNVSDRTSSDHDRQAETLAWVKRIYLKHIFANKDYYELGELPTSIDFLLIAAGIADGGVSKTSARRAISSFSRLEDCPRCGEKITPKQDEKDTGKRSDPDLSLQPHKCSTCDWDEKTDSITTSESAQARATAWLRHPDRGGQDNSSYLKYKQLRHPDDLPPPENTLLLDATPTSAFYQYLFDVEESDIRQLGSERIETNANITQIVDGRYHRGTICQTDSDGRGERRRERIQEFMTKTCEEHRGTNDGGPDVVIVGHQRARKQGYFQVPDNAEWIDFYTGRGLDRKNAGALIVIGAPFPNPRALNQLAKLLTVGKDVDIGEIIHSEEEQDTNQFLQSSRRYLYDDGSGNGYRVDIKPRTGLLGELLEDKREREILQMLHRIRPVLADEPKDIFLLTNVRIDIPITTLTTMETLLDWRRSKPVDLLEGRGKSVLDLASQLFESPPRSTPLSEHWDMQDSSLDATVKDIHKLYCKEIDEVTTPTIRTAMSELRSVNIIERSEERQGRSYVYTFSEDNIRKVQRIIEKSTDLSVNDRQQLRAVVPEMSDSDDWIDDAQAFVNHCTD
jgi:predicted transcriptional regulator